MKTKKLTAAQIARVLSYGIEWLRHMPTTTPIGKNYFMGGIESVSHVGACLICQDLVNKESVPTCDISSLLLDLPTENEIVTGVNAYAKSFKHSK